MSRTAFEYVSAHVHQAIEELKALCRHASLASRPEEVSATAVVVKGILESLGANPVLISVEGSPPVVYGEIKGEKDRTVLFYNHYDVQPPDPIEEWEKPPFEGVIEDGVFYSRGAADNKGDLLSRIKAVEAVLKTRGRLPVSVKFLFEGEEEVGSPNLGRFVKGHPEKVKADLCIWEGGGKDIHGRPQAFLGCKGLCYAELEATGAAFDLHSSDAPVVPNPAWRLVWALACLKDGKEEIRVPGFFEHVRKPTSEELRCIEDLPSDEDELKTKLGIRDFILGLSGADSRKRLYFEPTCTICGLTSGYEGPGPKTVLPGRAVAKVDMRLVPDQDPEDIKRKFEDHLASCGYGDIKIRWFTSEHPSRTPMDNPAVGVAIKAGRIVYGVDPFVYPTTPATGPRYQICGEFNTPAIGIGVSHALSRMHGPDENIRIDDFVQGTKYVIAILDLLARA